MKHFFYSFLFTVCVISCSYELDNGLSSLAGDHLIVKTNVAPTLTRSFNQTDAIGLFVTAGNINNPYDDNESNLNIKATYNGQAWETDPIFLSGNLATIFAYYPYSPSVSGDRIPIETDSQIDYLYGTHTVTDPEQKINNKNCTVDLTMKHALSLLCFNFSKKNYTGKGKLTSIEILNAENKSMISNEGYINCASGELFPTVATTASVKVTDENEGLIPLIPDIFSEANICTVKIIPTEDIRTEGDVYFRFIIDNQEYTFDIKAGTRWSQGVKYTYNITLEGTEITDQNVSVSIEEWMTGKGENITVKY